MGKYYSVDLRERIVHAVEGGMLRRGAARVFEVSASTAVKLLQRWRRTGSVRPDRIGHPRRSKLDPHEAWLLNLVRDEPDITLEEIRSRLRGRGVSASMGLVWKFFDRHDVSFKKNAARKRAAARGR